MNGPAFLARSQKLFFSSLGCSVEEKSYHFHPYAKVLGKKKFHFQIPPTSPHNKKERKTYL
jgi:hypothetical protein